MGALRVWWIPQVGMRETFYAFVNTIKEATLLLNTLAEYDLFQLNNNIKPDYSNVGGLEVKVGDDTWEEWTNEDGEDIMEVMEELGYDK